ncbi:helix-turn-helix domain-containing protein [Planctomycetes bacterium TBK1r]|uniref:Uncharacterized protein n=1 Tax=Stieleria magnilauensis TaxID=2527963 RepID=A0ABX5XHF2_9BACT|nr:hypothetical protein TBK1r_01520 [Planctomycetes bacterium TBK1r]
MKNFDQAGNLLTITPYNMPIPASSPPPSFDFIEFLSLESTMPSPDEQCEFVLLILDKIALIPEPKQRAVLAMILIDSIYHGSQHNELARVLGSSPSAFSRLRARGLISLGRLIREDSELTEWLAEHAFNPALINELLCGMFRPRS